MSIDQPSSAVIDAEPENFGLSEQIVNPALLTKKKLSMSTPWKAEQCGNCIFFAELSSQEKMQALGGNITASPDIGDCQESPPIPMLLGTRGGNPIIHAFHPRLPVTHKACGKFVKNTV